MAGVRNDDYFSRVRLGALLLLVGTALLTNLANWGGALWSGRPGAARDGVALADKRCQALKGDLPGRGIVGYVDDGQDDLDSTKEYYLTQYALAPVVVARNAERDLVVGNFRRADSGARKAASAGLEVVRDYRNGLFLLRRKK